MNIYFYKTNDVFFITPKNATLIAPHRKHFCQDFCQRFCPKQEKISDVVSEIINESGTLEATRTPDPQLRRLLLYPTELQAHLFCLFILNKTKLLCKCFNYHNEAFQRRIEQHP